MDQLNENATADGPGRSPLETRGESKGGSGGNEENGVAELHNSLHEQQQPNVAPSEGRNNVAANNNPQNREEKPPVHRQTPVKPAFVSEEDAKWHSVGVFQGLTSNVSSYIDNSVWSSSGLTLTSEDLPVLSQFPRINLEPGAAYRFRLRAINTCGASDWSEISSFKTCLPGFPGAPSAIKISKSSEGAHLTWEPPPSCMNTNEIIEYSVYLAVKPNKEKDTKMGATQSQPQRSPAQLAFVRVYVGPVNQCTVAQSSLSAAHVDCSNKPAIIFRIAARNEKGYGPATQVRWLQDPMQANVNVNVNVNANASLLSPTRIKSEQLGAASSPIKRFKPSMPSGSGATGGGAV